MYRENLKVQFFCKGGKMDTLKISSTTLDWLLQEENSPVAYLVCKNILEDEKRAEEYKEKIPQYNPIKEIIRKKDLFLSSKVKPYEKYKGCFWAFKHLEDLWALDILPEIKEIATHILSLQNKDGSFSPSPSEQPLVCLTSFTLESLIKAGYGYHHKVVRGVNYITYHINKYGGVFCPHVKLSYRDRCLKAVPKALSLLNVARFYANSNAVVKAQKILRNILIHNKIYFHSFLEAKKYDEEVKKITQGVPEDKIPLVVEEFRANFLKKFPPQKPEPEEKWMKISYPTFKSTNVLEALVSLVDMGISYRDELKPALTLLIHKQKEDGLWYQECTPKEETLAPIDKVNTPSPWITYFVLYAFKKLNLLTIE